MRLTTPIGDCDDGERSCHDALPWLISVSLDDYETWLFVMIPRDERRRLAKAIVFDVGGVLIDLHSEDASRELVEKYGFLSKAFAQLAEFMTKGF